MAALGHVCKPTLQAHLMSLASREAGISSVCWNRWNRRKLGFAMLRKNAWHHANDAKKMPSMPRCRQCWSCWSCHQALNRDYVTRPEFRVPTRDHIWNHMITFSDDGDVLIVLWFSKFRLTLPAGDCARRIQASPARSRQAPGCCGSPGMTISVLRNNVSQNMSELWCFPAWWRIFDWRFWHIRWVLHSCALFSHDRKIQKAGARRKAGSMNRALPLTNSDRIPWTYQGDHNCTPEIPFGFRLVQ